jgi:hypothetical protein
LKKGDDDGGGWVKIHRKIMDWEWESDSNVFLLFVKLILLANHKDTKWKGVIVRRGQLVTGFRSLAKRTRLSMQVLRTSLERLKSTREITLESTHIYTTITICNYDKYNASKKPTNTQINTQTNTQATREQHTTNTIQEDQELKNEKNNINITPPLILEPNSIPIPKLKRIKPRFNPEGKTKFLDWVYMDKDQWARIKQYYEQRGLDWDDLQEAIRELDTWFTNNPHMRAERTDDAKALMGWPLENALKRKRSLIYTKKAEEQ